MKGITHPNKVRRNTSCQLLIRCQLLVRRRRWVDHQRLGVAHIRKVTRQLERVDNFGAHRRVFAAVYSEA